MWSFLWSEWCDPVIFPREGNHAVSFEGVMVLGVFQTGNACGCVSMLWLCVCLINILAQTNFHLFLKPVSLFRKAPKERGALQRRAQEAESIRAPLQAGLSWSNAPLRPQQPGSPHAPATHGAPGGIRLAQGHQTHAAQQGTLRCPELMRTQVPAGL